MPIKNWKEVDKGNAIFAFEKGDWAVSLIEPTNYNPNAELRIINFLTSQRITIPGSPSILLNMSKSDILKKAEIYIKRSENDKKWKSKKLKKYRTGD